MKKISKGKNNVVSYSEGLSNFLTYLRNCEEEYKIASSEEQECADATQDILHYFELTKYNRTDFAKMARKQKEIREHRRKTKEIMEQIKPIKDWIDDRKMQIKDMEQVLGALKKAEKNVHRYKVYVPKTKEIFDTQINTGYTSLENTYAKT